MLFLSLSSAQPVIVVVVNVTRFWKKDWPLYGWRGI